MPASKPLRVAVVQFEVTAEVSLNLRKIERYAREAKAGKADVVLFSECCLSGYPPLNRNRLNRGAAVLIEGALVRIRALARELRLWILFGSVRLRGGHWYNSAFAVRPDGRLAAIYDKTHLVCGRWGDIAYFEAGNRLPTFMVRGVRCAMLICLDARFPEPFRYLRSQGVKVIFIPFLVAGEHARWKLPVLEGTLRCRAAENGVHVAASNCSGPDQALLSRVCDPNGLSIGEAKLGREGLFVAEIDTSIRGGGFFDIRRTDLFDLRSRVRH